MNYLKKFLAITLIFVMQFQSVHASVAVGGGWSLGNPVVNGATTTWEAVKNGARSTVAISPSSAQVVKSLLRGGLVGLALSAVTQALLDGIDYVMDSANNSITYKKKQTGPCSLNGSNCDTFEYFYASNSGVGNCDLYARGDSCFSSASSACDALVPIFDRKVVSYPPLYGGDCKLEGSNYYIFRINKYKNKSYNPKLTSGLTEKTIPLTTLATQIINLAEQGNPEAKAYIASVVQDMLEHDEDYRKSLEAQLDAKLKEATQTKKPNDGCPPNAIRNKNGDCWICSEASRKPIKARVDKAKDQTNNLAGCKGNMSKSELQLRFDAYSEFVSAREAENQCWLPPDEGHVRSANEMKITVKQCEKLIRRLSK